ncbi:MAG TPA: alpha/beta hydrolase [Myxococcaceae bacterium]|nr:alpha/beta hydrolase [Myxococcaceae bacterium]
MARLSIGDAELNFGDQGQGIPVLLLHGFPTSHLLWRDVAVALAARGFRTITPDLVGFGQSTAAEALEIHVANQARWMWELIDGLGLEEPPVVVAHDIGSAVAQLMVVGRPGRIQKLILIDGVYADRWAMEEVESIRKWDPSRASALSRLLTRNVRKWTRSTAAAGLLGEMLADYEGEAGGHRLMRIARSFDPQQTARILEQLQRQHPPSLILWGEDDVFLSVAEVARPLADLLGADLKVLPGGHFLPIECPAVVAAEIEGFAR